MTTTHFRETTHRIIEAIEEGLLDRDLVIQSCLCYLSEADVVLMAEKNELFPNVDDVDDDGS
jgi:hypothetical protein